MIKRIIHQEIILIHTCEPNNRASKYVKQKLAKLKGEIDKSVVILGDFNTPFL